MLLLPRHRALLDDLLGRMLPPTAEVWAYGSRVTGQAHEASDLDLVVRGPSLQPVDAQRLHSLRILLEESNLPILVDVHDWAHLPERFHARILARYEVLRPAQAEAPVAAVAGL